MEKFGHEINGSLGEVDMTAQRAISWLSHEMMPYWQKEIRVRTELIARARAELLRKQMSSSLEDPSCVDERKALQRAKDALEHAQEKLKLVRKWLITLDKEVTLYKGAAQPLVDVGQRDMPLAVHRLGQLTKRLEEYHAVATAPPKPVSSVAADANAADSMARQADATNAGEPSEPLDVALQWVRLRRLLPTPAGRAATAPNAASISAWSVKAEEVPGQLLPPDADPGATDLLASMSGAAPSAETRVILAAGALDGRDFFFARQPAADTSDSGWFIAPIDVLAIENPDVGLTAVPLAWLLQRRPWIADYLGLPFGHLVVVMSGTLLCAIDERDRTIYDGSGADIARNNAGGAA